MYRHGKEAEKLVLKKSDYLAYRVRCLSMLREPQIRGALSYGGVIWRLTLELLLADDGLYHRAVELCVAGPVLDRGKDSLVLVFPSGADGTLYVDNRINDQQADILCGMYWRYCGKFDDTLTVEHLSWWPKPAVWKSSGFNTGIWNPSNEDWFQQRMLAIQDGTEMPRNGDRWRSSMKFNQYTSRLANSVEKAAVPVLNKHFGSA
ncbi:hypothetical protein OH76DRAFT_1366266 [Lentinus brumalis]|uniref:Uncharacterized protein n=1 Tax=Lentinus brumalis TaxID=2498619 RepID=A0A371CJG2_9APHY|nr:hypothetical protein OH76DRAFT_1366266 [Polyporus brumalis]